MELKEEKHNALQRELEEMTFGGGTEEEVAQLKRSKLDLEKRYKEQEEELDEMAGQIQVTLPCLLVPTKVFNEIFDL